MSGEFEQLMYLRELSRTTGLLMEPQVLQLRRYPYAAGFSDSSLSLDINGKRVVYDLVQPRKHASIFRKADAAKALAMWVKTLLGDEWSLELRVRGRRYLWGLFRGKDEVLEFGPGAVR